MARINLEDDLFRDIRFIRFSEKLGSLPEALGSICLAWISAQKYWFPDKKPIPIQVFKLIQNNQLMIDCGLAELTENGNSVYIKGSETQFSWLIQKSKAGKKSAQVRKNTGVEIIKEKVQRRSTAFNGVPTAGQRRGNGSQPLTLTPTLTPTHNIKSEGEKTNSVDLSPKGSLSKAQPPPVLFDLWNQLCDKLPKAKALNSSRRKRILARWKENPDEAYWRSVIESIAKSPFCNGANERGWRASFDWLLQPDTHLKVFEGKYDKQKIESTNWDYVFGESK